jgi:hypothetical protein
MTMSKVQTIIDQFLKICSRQNLTRLFQPEVDLDIKSKFEEFNQMIIGNQAPLSPPQSPFD